MTLGALWREIREILAGRTLSRAIERNRRAAEGLDAAVREVLRK